VFKNKYYFVEDVDRIFYSEDKFVPVFM